MAFTVDDIKCRVIPVAEKYGVKSVILFGSCARGEALGCHADVITTGIEDKNFLDGIKQESIILYEGA